MNMKDLEENTIYAIVLNSGDYIIARYYAINASGDISLQNPLKLEWEYSENQQPILRYFPWQIVSNTNIVSLNKDQVLFLAEAKPELIGVYEQVQAAFVQTFKAGKLADAKEEKGVTESVE